jgi:hypothetical protein
MRFPDDPPGASLNPRSQFKVACASELIGAISRRAFMRKPAARSAFYAARPALLRLSGGADQ